MTPPLLLLLLLPLLLMLLFRRKLELLLLLIIMDDVPVFMMGTSNTPRLPTILLLLPTIDDYLGRTIDERYSHQNQHGMHIHTKQQERGKRRWSLARTHTIIPSFL
jgi:hypothetical protein